jgi:hypothetical protein
VRFAYVKSPVASLYLVCSSVRKRVNVTILVLMVAVSAGGTSPFEAMVVVVGANAEGVDWD